MIHAGGKRRTAVAVTAETRMVVDLDEVEFTRFRIFTMGFAAPRPGDGWPMRLARKLFRNVLRREILPPIEEEHPTKSATLHLLFRNECELFLHGPEAIAMQVAIESCNEQRFKDASDKRIRRETPIPGSTGSGQ